MLTRNLGRTDRPSSPALRGLSYSSHRVLPIIVALAGATFMTTGTSASVPSYKLLGLNTSR